MVTTINTFQLYIKNITAWVSNILPHTAKVVDDLTIVRSLHHGVSNHSSACYMSHTGYSMAGKPSMGSWITYGLGSVNDNLPSFVVLDCGQGPSGGAPSWGSGFLPSSFQGTLFTNNETPIEYIRSVESNSRKLNCRIPSGADAVGTFNSISAN